jgi:hypothetical protein
MKLFATLLQRTPVSAYRGIVLVKPDRWVRELNHELP